MSDLVWTPRVWSASLNLIHMSIKQKSGETGSGGFDWEARSMYGKANGAASTRERAEKHVLDAAKLLQAQLEEIEGR